MSLSLLVVNTSSSASLNWKRVFSTAGKIREGFCVAGGFHFCPSTSGTLFNIWILGHSLMTAITNQWFHFLKCRGKYIIAFCNGQCINKRVPYFSDFYNYQQNDPNCSFLDTSAIQLNSLHSTGLSSWCMTNRAIKKFKSYFWLLEPWKRGKEEYHFLWLEIQEFQLLTQTEARGKLWNLWGNSRSSCLNQIVIPIHSDHNDIGQ